VLKMSESNPLRLTALLTLAATLLLSQPTIAQLAPPAASPLKLPPELPSATGYSTLDALPGITFSQPVAIATPPGEKDRLFVVEKTGRIQVVTNLSTQPHKQVFLDVAAVVAARHEGTLETHGEMGVLGLAFHPNFAQNGYFYVTYDLAVPENGDTKLFDCIARYRVSPADSNLADPQSETPMITQLDHANNHNGGDVHFGPDGYLYFSNGDEGAGNDSFNNARFIDKDFFAAIFRLDVDQRPGSLMPNPHSQDSRTYPSAVHGGTYKIPADNPFINAREHSGRTLDPRKIRTEIWATGLRNAWRFSFDPQTERMFIGDVGQNMWEEVDIGVAGGDYGWSWLEGTHRGPRFDHMPADARTIAPIAEYPHRNGDNCIIGGVVHRGSHLSELYGDYLYSDFGSGRIWALRQTGDKWTTSTLVERDDAMAAFGVDPSTGDVLMAAHHAGRIKRLVRTGTQGPKPPKLLSHTGAFADLPNLTADPALVSYTPNVAFWSDYALKTRWFALPNSGAKITFSRDGNWTFPPGTVWVKHFDMEMRRGDPTSRRRLETRFLVKTAAGSYGVTYKWRADQSDADLVPELGMDEVLDIKVNGADHKQTWHYPGRAECLTCHTHIAGEALGFNTRQLNGPATFGHASLNQIQALSDAGYFTQPVPAVKELPAFAVATDQSQPLEWRVRSYLAVNCVQCHQPGAGAIGYWDARPTTATADANLIQGRLVNNTGDPATHWMVPGDAQHSMILKRLQAQGVPRMPPLATTELDPMAIALIQQWIAKTPATH
jgi:glucose/arabinose dehydrogenase